MYLRRRWVAKPNPKECRPSPSVSQAITESESMSSPLHLSLSLCIRISFFTSLAPFTVKSKPTGRRGMVGRKGRSQIRAVLPHTNVVPATWRANEEGKVRKGRRARKSAERGGSTHGKALLDEGKDARDTQTMKISRAKEKHSHSHPAIEHVLGPSGQPRRLVVDESCNGSAASEKVISEGYWARREQTKEWGREVEGEGASGKGGEEESEMAGRIGRD
ncbi:hypothetical protein C8R45DRAFT_1157488 [Mycena sanguinolenta]|nr:hypothetical protein C8R45DRAFT_1157488 [Mycena sanguinolenta]